MSHATVAVCFLTPYHCSLLSSGWIWRTGWIWRSNCLWNWNLSSFCNIKRGFYDLSVFHRQNQALHIFLSVLDDCRALVNYPCELVAHKSKSTWLVMTIEVSHEISVIPVGTIIRNKVDVFNLASLVASNFINVLLFWPAKKIIGWNRYQVDGIDSKIRSKHEWCNFTSLI